MSTARIGRAAAALSVWSVAALACSGDGTRGLDAASGSDARDGRDGGQSGDIAADGSQISEHGDGTDSPAADEPAPADHASDLPVDTPRGAPVYPLKASGSGRYLVDQIGQPVFLVGDSPHAMFANLSVSEAATYLANRASYGINVIWVELLCGSYIPNCRSNLATFDGIVPFSIPGDISMPNPAYFARVDALVALAADNGINILMDTLETGAELDLLRHAGNQKSFEYGAYLGNRYKDSPNIIWITGNDFQSWRDATDNELIKNLMAGVASADPNHLATDQLDYQVSGSHDDTLLLPLTTLAAVYTYFPPYAEITVEYDATPTLPVFLEEANYEGENNTGRDPSTNLRLRKQEYWSMLAGALAGQMYGSATTTYFRPGWDSGLDTPGIRQLRIMKQFFSARAWHRLQPDQDHQVVTAGYGTFSSSDSITSNDYATTASADDGSWIAAYLPTQRTVTVDMTKLAGPATARWFDPAAGTYADAGGSGLQNSGTRKFTPPGNNQDGDGDWVLLIEVD